MGARRKHAECVFFFGRPIRDVAKVAKGGTLFCGSIASARKSVSAVGYRISVYHPEVISNSMKKPVYK